jgi:hypothetical protein
LHAAIIICFPSHRSLNINNRIPHPLLNVMHVSDNCMSHLPKRQRKIPRLQSKLACLQLKQLQLLLLLLLLQLLQSLNKKTNPSNSSSGGNPWQL